MRTHLLCTLNAAGASTIIFGRALTDLGTPSQAACICSLCTGIAGGNPPASCCVSTSGCSCVFVTVLSMVSGSSSCLRNKAAELLRASWYVHSSHRALYMSCATFHATCMSANHATLSLLRCGQRQLHHHQVVRRETTMSHDLSIAALDKCWLDLQLLCWKGC